ncbi:MULTISPECIES: hypothetical protein [Prochlorococcus]|uniref:hypothetical protein n=1 Tax=Prochlorococcus TaxID=1218 RepID=UPI001F41A4AB|nr:hypothetical protein [Prochlorococcus marinus]
MGDDPKLTGKEVGGSNCTRFAQEADHCIQLSDAIHKSPMDYQAQEEHAEKLHPSQVGGLRQPKKPTVKSLRDNIRRQA